jgi:integrase
LEWPARDRALWDAAIAPGGFFEEAGRGAHMRPTSLKSRMKGYGTWLVYLAAHGPIPDEMPSRRATNERIHDYVAWLKAQDLAPLTICSYLDALRGTLRLLERNCDVANLSRALERLHLNAIPVRNKTVRMKSPREVLGAAFEYMDSLSVSPPTRERSGRYMDGLIVAFLSQHPIRAKNCAGLELDEHLVKRADGWRCSLKATETKEKRSYECTLAPELVPYLEHYLAVDRPILLGELSSKQVWLTESGGPFNTKTLWNKVTALTRQLFGIAMNPHLFRDCAVTAVAVDAPEHVASVARLLGHNSLRTTERHYNQASMISAQKYHLTVLEEIMIETEMHADCGF